jgi:transcriptional regulator with XRE-family HTH domain
VNNEQPIPDRRGWQTVAQIVADNIRAYRQIRGLDQAQLAQRMQSLGIGWRRPTVSEVERKQRNVTVAEALGLTLALNVTVAQLVDSRGPEARRGPRLWLAEGPELIKVSEDDGSGYQVVGLAIPPERVTALICSHKAYVDAKWNDKQQYKGLTFVHEESE